MDTKKLNNDLSSQWEFQFLSGLSDLSVSEFYKIKTEAEKSTCDVCISMSKKLFLKKDAVLGENFPPFHPNCRCKAVDKHGNLVFINERQYQDMMLLSYGFTPNESVLVLKACQLLLDEADKSNLNRIEKIHLIFSNLAPLCNSYNGEAFKWKASADLPTTADAKHHLITLGMSENEVELLYEIINKQYLSASIYGKDFAHELVQYAVFSDDSWMHNILDGLIGNMNALGSYKGDVFSTNMGIDDMNSDLDATNIYNRMIASSKDFFDIMLDYNMCVEKKHINRFDEFLRTYGDGDAEKGLEYIKKDLSNVDTGSHFIGGNFNGILGFIWENIQDAISINAMVEGGGALLGEEKLSNIFKMNNANKVFQESVERKKTSKV